MEYVEASAKTSENIHTVFETLGKKLVDKKELANSSRGKQRSLKLDN